MEKDILKFILILALATIIVLLCRSRPIIIIYDNAVPREGDIISLQEVKEFEDDYIDDSLLDTIDDIGGVLHFSVSDHKYDARDISSITCSFPSNDVRFDCHPEENGTKEVCVDRGCCWSPLNNQGVSSPPSCYYPKDYPGYKVISVKNTTMGFSANLSRNTKSYYPKDVITLSVDVLYETDTRVRIKIYDPSEKRYEVPLEVPNVRKPASNPQYEVIFSRVGEEFSFSVVGKNAATPNKPRVLINTTNAAPFIFTDQFIQLSTYLPSKILYGLGEYRGPLLHSMDWTRRTIWNRDQPPQENNVGANLYGAHPFYLVIEESIAQAHGVFLLNSNAMDIDLQPAPALTWKPIGGIIDMYVFTGPSPADVVRQYTEVIGHTFMPPYWSLGYHQSRWGYKTANHTLEVVERVRQAGIPQDVQWNDIEYSDGRKDFTTGYNTFGDQPAMVAQLHQKGIRYILITDCGISSSQPSGTYPPLDVGMEMDIFMKNKSGLPLIGQVWPGETVWPDFTNPKTTEYWTKMIRDYHSRVPFDGLWIDMNEVSNFGNGSIHGCPGDNHDNPPYLPHVSNGTMYYYTVCPSARQNASINYNVHNLYGFTEMKATNMALRATIPGKRPFIISRSTFAGSGYYGGHWNGDNYARYEDMHTSIIDILNMNMLGIPMMGACVCGFMEDTTEQLCQRWTQLGSFYPFYWNHNDRQWIPQDPAAFSDKMTDAARKVHLTRYSLLPYFYTLFYESHKSGDTVVRPLFFEYVNDPNTYPIDKQFLWGPALLVTPVLEEDKTQIQGYFPNDTWYDFYTGDKIEGKGSMVTLDAPMDKINLHVRAGYVLPLQDPDINTDRSRKNRFRLLVAMNSSSMAFGSLFWDDGESLDTDVKGLYNELEFLAMRGSLTVLMRKSGYMAEYMTLGSVTVFGIDRNITEVVLNDLPVHFTYDAKFKVLHVYNLVADLFHGVALRWS